MSHEVQTLDTVSPLIVEFSLMVLESHEWHKKKVYATWYSRDTMVASLIGKLKYQEKKKINKGIWKW